MKETVTNLLKQHKAPLMIIVAHASNIEAICRSMRGMKYLDELNFSRCVEGIPFLADAYLVEEGIGLLL